jgi:exopolysaccharide production protein ExoY
MDLIFWALLGMAGLLGAAFSKVLAEELKAWRPSLVGKIIALAVRKLPSANRERFSEEWKSHINEIPGDVGKIVVACGCLTAAWDIAEGPFGARKRALDLAFATFGLLVESPLLIVVALAVMTTSPGPVLFRITRIGRDGKRFHSLKFRTMHADAHDRLRKYFASNPEAEREWNTTRRLRFDPRVTAFGAILRKTSLDELPQLFNVVAGDMSLVGPRMITDDDIGDQTRSADTDPSCKPGITGPWRFGRHFKNVASYRSNWSLMLDVKIIVATLGTALRSDGTDRFELDFRIGLLIIGLVLVLVGAITIG